MVYDFYEKFDENILLILKVKKHEFNFLLQMNMEYILILLNDFSIKLTHIISLIFLL